MRNVLVCPISGPAVTFRCSELTFWCGCPRWHLVVHLASQVLWNAVWDNHKTWKYYKIKRYWYQVFGSTTDDHVPMA